MHCTHPLHIGASDCPREAFVFYPPGTDICHPYCVTCLHTWGTADATQSDAPGASVPAEVWRDVQRGRVLQRTFAALWEACRQESAGGSCTPPANRLLLLGLALTLGSRDILELGYDEGTTTIVLALSGARVVAVDNLSEFPETDGVARQRFAAFPTIEAHIAHAEAFLRTCPPESFDLIFVDDSHLVKHVTEEACLLQSVLRPGGVVCFHDTKIHPLWAVLTETFPPTWQRFHLPSIQWRQDYKDQDFGLGVLQKPALGV